MRKNSFHNAVRSLGYRMGKRHRSSDEKPDFSELFQPPYDALAEVGYQEGVAFNMNHHTEDTWQTMKVTELVSDRVPSMGKTSWTPEMVEQAEWQVGTPYEIVPASRVGSDGKYSQPALDGFEHMTHIAEDHGVYE